MADIYIVHIHENYGRIVKNGSQEITRIDHSSGLSFDVFSELAHHAFHLADYVAGDTIELHLESGVVFSCDDEGCGY
jgi:hypothetical protein